MIVGIGTDLLDIVRIRTVYERHGERFMSRVLTLYERDVCVSKRDPVLYLAKRWAAKEAASKALGTGIGKVSFHDMEVRNNDAGAPQLLFSGAAQQQLEAMGGSRVHLSMSDERDQVLAFVVLDG